MASSYDQVQAEITARKASLRQFLLPLFEGHTRFTLEIGCGHGHYLTAYAQAHPEELCIGIDICNNRIVRGNKKKSAHNLNNLHFIKSEASEFLECLPLSVKPNKIFILFPDPWPKNRHHKNRLIQPEFLALLAQFSLPETPLYFRTDHDEYFEWTTKRISSHPQWHLESTFSWPFEAPSVFQQKMPRYQSLAATRTLL